MVKQADLIRVKRVLDNHIGSKVKIKANKGRHKIDIMEGVISETYTSIFMVEPTKTSNSSQAVSFSYADILTKDVRLSLCSES